MRENKINFEEDFRNIVIMTFTLKSRYLTEVTLANIRLNNKVLLPNGKWVEKKGFLYSVFSISNDEDESSSYKMNVWTNGHDFVYKIDSSGDWHIWPAYSGHIAKKFKLTSLEDDNECELWYLFRMTEKKQSGLLDTGGQITVLWVGEVTPNDDLYMSFNKQMLTIEFGHGFGIFLGGNFKKYKSLYESLKSNN